MVRNKKNNNRKESKVASGFTTNPWVFHFVNIKTEITIMGSGYATRHIRVTRTVTSNGLRAHFMALLDVKKVAQWFKNPLWLFTDEAGQYAKSWMGMKNLVVERKRVPLSNFPIWNAGACPGIPHRGFAGTQCSQCLTQTNLHLTAGLPPPYECK